MFCREALFSRKQYAACAARTAFIHWLTGLAAVAMMAMQLFWVNGFLPRLL
jgi:hypothetical protein